MVWLKGGCDKVLFWSRQSQLVCLPEVGLDHQGSDNDTALHCAVQGKHEDVVQVLIDAGADTER